MKNRKPYSNLLLQVLGAFAFSFLIIGVATITIIPILCGISFFITILCTGSLIWQMYLRKKIKKDQLEIPYVKHITSEEWNINEILTSMPGDRNIHMDEVDKKLGMEYEYLEKKDKYGNTTLSVEQLNILPHILGFLFLFGITIMCAFQIITNQIQGIQDIILFILITLALAAGSAFFAKNIIKIIKIKLKNKKKKTERNKLFYILNQVIIILFILILCYFFYFMYTKKINEKIFLILFISLAVALTLAFIVQVILVSIVYFKRINKK